MGFLDRLTGKISGTIRMARGNDDLADGGIRGTATILEVSDTGRTVGLAASDGTVDSGSERQVFRVHARVTLPGRAVYEVTHETTQDPPAGSKVACFIDPDDDQRVHYDVGIADTILGAADPTAAAALRDSLSRMLGRPVGESPADLQQAMDEVANMDDATKQRNWNSPQQP